MQVSGLNGWEALQEFLLHLEVDLSGSVGGLSSPPGCQEADLKGLASPDCKRPWPLCHSELISAQEHILVDLPYSQSC